MLNLLSNAVKFTPAGGQIRLNVTGNSDGMVGIAVSDTGIGISPADQERIFEPFRRGEASVSRSHEGTGLGLAITKRLVELSGGKLALESQLGAGTTVTVWLPTAPAGSLADPVPIASDGPSRSPVWDTTPLKSFDNLRDIGAAE